MLNFNIKSIEFINNHLPEESQKTIFSAKTTNEVLDILSEWIDLCEECWEENGEDYSDLGRQAQHVYDDIYLNN